MGYDSDNNTKRTRECAALMRSGKWWTPGEIADLLKCGTATATARIRDLRKYPRKWIIERRHSHTTEDGTIVYKYRRVI